MTEYEWKQLLEYIRDLVEKHGYKDLEKEFIAGVFDSSNPKTRVVLYIKYFISRMKSKTSDQGKQLLNMFNQEYILTSIEDVILELDEIEREKNRTNLESISLIRSSEIDDDIISDLSRYMYLLEDIPFDGPSNEFNPSPFKR